MRKRLDVANIAHLHWIEWVHRASPMRSMMLRFYERMLIRHTDAAHHAEISALTLKAIVRG